jgi:hypothetical protein
VGLHAQAHTFRHQRHPILILQAVSTDPSKANIQLINPASPNDPITLAEEIDTSSGSYIYTPSSALTAGSQYRVNLVGVSNSQKGILAQSGYFEVKQGQR